MVKSSTFTGFKSWCCWSQCLGNCSEPQLSLQIMELTILIYGVIVGIELAGFGMDLECLAQCRVGISMCL